MQRLFVQNQLIKDTVIELSKEDNHYMLNVLRKKQQDKIRVFNDQDGEWECEIIKIAHKKVFINVIALIKKYQKQDIYSILAFSMLKKKYNNIIIEKATELNVCKIYPIITERTITKNIHLNKVLRIAKIEK